MASVNLHDYRDVLDVEDLLDFLISKSLITRNNYAIVRQTAPENRRNCIIDGLNDEAKKTVLEYLDQSYPNILEHQRLYNEALVRGGFPRLPLRTVLRTNVAAELTNKLKNLDQFRQLVVYGMMGCGKSFLVNQVVQNVAIVRDYFNFKVFWVNLGEHHNLDNIMPTMWSLYSRAITAIKGNPISHCPDQVITLKDHLREVFLDKHMTNALLILDDAGCKDVIDAFDFGCKTLITTKSRSIVSQEHAEFVEVNVAFTEKECLDLFKKLGDGDSIRNYSTTICHLCQGYPLLIAAIFSFLWKNKDDVNNPRIWKSLEGALSRKQYDFSEEMERLNGIKICVNKLEEGLKSFFHDLVIFQQDVNIVPSVLEVLWNKDDLTVRKTMMDLTDRSLVVPFYHKDRETYVYGLHDLFHNYLKGETSKDNRIEMHKKLLEGYDRVTNGDYLKLPDDNYILQYIGYHLKEAERIEAFHIYLNLRFIERKIRAAGHADVLRDMDTYAEEIENTGPDSPKKLKDYRQFVLRYGKEIFYNDKMDIIQFGLLEEPQSHVYQDAYSYAQTNSQHPYFKIRGKSVKTRTWVQRDSRDLTAACYLDQNVIFVGLKSGVIEKYDNERNTNTLKKHTEPIKSLQLSDDQLHLLSLSEDGSVGLWHVRPNARKSLDMSANGDARDRQQGWQGIIYPESQISCKVFNSPRTKRGTEDDKYIAACFAPDFSTTREIALGTNKGVVSIWNTDTGTEIAKTGLAKGIPVFNLVFVVNEGDKAQVIFSLDQIIFVYGYNRLNNDGLQFLYQLYDKVPLSVFYNGFNLVEPEILSLNGETLNVWNKKLIKIPYNIVATDQAKMTKDCKYLIINSSEKALVLWDNEHRVALNRMNFVGSTRSLDTYYDEAHNVHKALICLDKKSLIECELFPEDQVAVNTNSPVFSTYWSPASIPFTAVRCLSNKIKIYRDRALVTEHTDKDITFTKICDDNTVIYGLGTGVVNLLKLNNRKITSLTQVSGPVTAIEVYGKFSDLDKKILVQSFNNITILYTGSKLNRNFDNPKLIFNVKDLLYVVEDTGCIKVWDLFLDSISIVNLLNKLRVTTAAVCNNKSELALTTESQGNLHFLKIDPTSIRCVNTIALNLRDNVPTFSCYSHTSDLLAVGTRSGEIRVCNTRPPYTMTVLQLHEKPVKHMRFSPGPQAILVSLGDHIAWWNLSTLQQRDTSYQLMQQNNDHDTMNTRYWASKLSSNMHGQYLMACIKLHEPYAKLVSASPDFTSFLIVNEMGGLYKMQVVDNLA